MVRLNLTRNLLSQQLLNSIKETVAQGLTNAIMGLVDGTKSLGESLSGILRQLGSMFLNAGFKSLFNFADGGVFQQGKVTPFAYGGVVSKPTLFPMANGAGLMGEAGPEAIMPLRRDRSGRLGVEAVSGGVGNVVVNVDASGSSVEGDAQGVNQLGKAIGIAVQSELVKQKTSWRLAGVMAIFNDATVGTSTGGTTPDFGAVRRSQPAVRKVQFGDGYEKRLTYGLNQNPRIWDLKWTAKTAQMLMRLRHFLTQEQMTMQLLIGVRLTTQTLISGL